MSDFGTTTAGWPEEARAALDRVAAIARAEVPDASEGVSYGLPALLVDGKALIGVSRQAKHLSLVPFSPPAIEAVRGDLDGFAASKGVIRFLPDRPVPDEVVRRLVRLRIAEIRPA
ncbi:iron chaperone [uncultured Amnibacterium sp.]|uniref:iron chaperone n=1 Tax=uncultured Amnibacterium sp. TaxID=1631851 RepID=UPI0035CC06F8